MTKRTILNLTVALATAFAAVGSAEAMPLASGLATPPVLGQSGPVVEKAALLVVRRRRPMVRVFRRRPVVRVIR